MAPEVMVALFSPDGKGEIEAHSFALLHWLFVNSGTMGALTMAVILSDLADQSRNKVLP